MSAIPYVADAGSASGGESTQSRSGTKWSTQSERHCEAASHLRAPLLSCSSPLLLLSTPLRSSPLLSTPLCSSPLRSAPIRSSPLLSAPLRFSPLLWPYLPSHRRPHFPSQQEGLGVETLAAEEARERWRGSGRQIMFLESGLRSLGGAHRPSGSPPSAVPSPHPHPHPSTSALTLTAHPRHSPSSLTFVTRHSPSALPCPDRFASGAHSDEDGGQAATRTGCLTP